MGEDQSHLSIVPNPLQEHCLDGNTDVVSLTNVEHTQTYPQCTEMLTKYTTSL